jgi:acyl carrier protein
LWFVALSSETRFFEYEAAELIREGVLEILAERLNLNKRELETNPSLLNDANLDSLELVEIEMEIEEEFENQGLKLPWGNEK